MLTQEEIDSWGDDYEDGDFVARPRLRPAQVAAESRSVAPAMRTQAAMMSFWQRTLTGRG